MAEVLFGFMSVPGVGKSQVRSATKSQGGEVCKGWEMTITTKSWLIVLFFALTLILMTCHRIAWSDELDEAEIELRDKLDGLAEVSRRPIPEFTPEEIEIIKKMQEELKEINGN